MSDRPGRSAIKVAALTVLTLGAGLVAAVPAYAVAGGSPVTEGSYRFVAQVQVGELRGCTGVLVQPQWVLTSTSCFAEGGQAVATGAPTTPTTVTIGRADLTGAGGHRLAATWVVPRSDRNAALVKLSAPVTDIAPAPIAVTAPSVGQTLTVAGFGRTKDEWVPDRLHTAAFTVQAVTPTTLDVTGVNADASICKGDSGGPALRESNGKVELVGLNHTSWQHGCFGSSETRNGAVETRVDDIADWITQSFDDRLLAGQSLKQGESIVSPDKRFVLIMQSDGNLVLYERGVKALWWTSFASDGVRADNRPDGDLVVYRADGTVNWSSNQGGKGPSTLVVRNDGNVVLSRNSDNAVTWNSGTGGHLPVPPHLTEPSSLLAVGQALVRGGAGLVSPDRQLGLYLQIDGNLVLRRGGAALWWTSVGDGAWFSNQPDGNLVTYTSTGVAVWDSGTSGNGAGTLALQNDGNLVLYRNSDNGVIWHSHTDGR